MEIINIANGQNTHGTLNWTNSLTPLGSTLWRSQFATSTRCEHTTEKLTGTVISVRNIFQHLPVRRKSFQASSELSTLRKTIGLIAIIFPGIAFNIINSSKSQTLLQLSESQSQVARISSVFELKLSSHLPVHEEFTLNDSLSVTLEGIVFIAELPSINSLPHKEPLTLCSPHANFLLLRLILTYFF